MPVRKLLACAGFAIFFGLTAGADLKTENYVRVNANEVLASLNEAGLSAEERRVKFQTYMDQFANLDAVAKFVIGKYSRRFSPEEMETYLASFRAYALAVYEYYFNEYRGQNVEVTGSIDRNPRDSIVDTEIISMSGDKMKVRWRVLNRQDKYQVVDVALSSEGNLIWLAIEQQAQFLSILDQNNGSVEALTDVIDAMTQEMVDLRAE